jgi:hypothetical protein
MLFSNFDLSPQQSANYYHLGFCYMQKELLKRLHTLKSKICQYQIRITDSDELLQLQNGLAIHGQ